MKRAAISVLALLIGGCSTPEPAGEAARPDSSAAQEVVRMPAPPDTVRLAKAIARRGLSFRPPEGWTHLPAASPIRIAQFVIPPAGVSSFGDLVVFHFGPGEGGTAHENIARWIRQFEAEDGSSVEEEADVSHFIEGDLVVTTLRVQGTMLPSRMAGPDGARRRPGWQMLAAVVEGPGGPWFFKATGPQATMERAEKGFAAMIRSLLVVRVP